MRVALKIRASVLSLALLSATTSAAGDLKGIVAVLPLDTANASISPQDRIALEESIRTVAGGVLQAVGFSVLTGETCSRCSRRTAST